MIGKKDDWQEVETALDIFCGAVAAECNDSVSNVILISRMLSGEGAGC